MALRPEPFGALAYHYGNRRLNFLRSPDLVAVVERLGDHPDVPAALVACGIDRRRWPAFGRALTALAASEFLEPSSGPGGNGVDPGSHRYEPGGHADGARISPETDGPETDGPETSTGTRTEKRDPT